MQLEFYLIENCAPTLASLKTASLFRCPCREEEDVFDALYRWNREFSRKGLRAVLLKRFTGSALIYVYRRSQLERDLKENGAKRLLETYGYQSIDPGYALNRLAGRLTSEGEFPHEIGLFLGYPIEDVKGFRKFGGSGCKMCGYWKVYDNVEQARRVFDSYDKCREFTAAQIRAGYSILQVVGMKHLCTSQMCV